MVSKARKATFYLNEDVYRALKLKSAQTNRSQSGLINEALEQTLNDDLVDIASLHKRSGGLSESYDDFLTGLRADSLI